MFTIVVSKDTIGCEGDHAQAHHRSGSGDSSSDRASAVAEVLLGVSPARMRSVWVSRLLTAS